MFTQDLPRIQNWINGQFVELVASSPSSETIQYLPVTSPYNAKTIGYVPQSSALDVAKAVAAAKEAFPAWSDRTIKDRAGILIRFHALMTKHADLLSDMVVLEHGKNKAEALASVSRGQDLVEYAMSLPHVSQTKILEVSKGITCYDSRVRKSKNMKGSPCWSVALFLCGTTIYNFAINEIALGVVASIVPFNFPVMVPLWTLSVAIVMGTVS